MHYDWLADSHMHPASAATHEDLVHAHFTQPFTATSSLHGPHLLLVQEVCLKGLTQLLHYLLVAIASCKQNCSAAILREGCKRGSYIKWVFVGRNEEVKLKVAHNGRVLHKCGRRENCGYCRAGTHTQHFGRCTV